ncbi:PQQ-like beta-propeller repeat protein [Stieleria sp. TO1_6]|uniref:PQQ-binding-like beta-propeller repeat protein n=1 Tax=Stieleria tagensis TaxID=2956795 RepID=UPI00209ABD6C|nr:PQQ-binding-like beta-propeller repeat protein [Stieleria tagensis]MCO8124380.1 PQQ-like beta-propeller repeat protein [Stieleria tagensis]
MPLSSPLHHPIRSLRSIAWAGIRATGLAVMVSALSSIAVAEDWPGFHGLAAAGVIPKSQLPESLFKQSPKWNLDLSTRDVGSMAIQDGSVYLLATAPAGDAIRLICVDLQSGQEKWSHEFPNAPNHLHARNTLASSTPATDDKYVYIAHSDRAQTWVRCLDHSGKVIWSRELGPAQGQHGFGASPVVHGETLLLNFSQQAERVTDGKPGVSRVYAFNRSTGETLWSTAMTSTRVCYGTPAVHGSMVIGANTGDGLYALALDSGALLWRLPVFKMRCVSSPIIAGDLVLGSSGSGGGGNHMVAVKIPRSTAEQPQEVYRIEKGAPYVPTAVVSDGALFTVDDTGIASCFDAASGDLEWKKRIGGNFGASPILIGDQLLLINLDGEATVLKASREFEALGKVDLGGPVGATPAFADGRLLIRVGTELVCY